jgi:hypothetical protein
VRLRLILDARGVVVPVLLGSGTVGPSGAEPAEQVTQSHGYSMNGSRSPELAAQARAIERVVVTEGQDGDGDVPRRVIAPQRHHQGGALRDVVAPQLQSLLCAVNPMPSSTSSTFRCSASHLPDRSTIRTS